MELQALANSSCFTLPAEYGVLCNLVYGNLDLLHLPVPQVIF